MSRARLIALLTPLALLASGCGAPGDSTPVACLDGAGAYLGALGDAPGEVRLSGEASISDCLAENQKTGDLATVGAAMLTATTKLNGETRSKPGGAANVQLGYLLTTPPRAAQGTARSHTQLICR